MADTKFRLNLDSTEFIESAKKASEALEKLGSSGESLKGLVGSFGEIAAVAGVVGSALLVLKTVMGSVFEAENIKAVNSQFELLSKNAGVSSEALKEGLEKASNGLVTETDLLKDANNALVTMGGSASKLPELMELARKATAVFGGDFVQNFEQMNQALATGNMRMLKHMGIIIDEQKALREYAVAHGTVVSALSQEEKQQALVNAALEKGKTAFAGVNTELKVNNTAWQQLKVILSEIMESIALLANTFFGKYLKSSIDLATGSAKELHTYLVDKFGEGVEQARAHSKRLQSEYDDLNKKLKELNTTGQVFFNGTLVQKGTAQGDAAIDQMTKKMAALKSQIDQSTKSVEGFEQKSASIGKSGGAGGPAVDNTKRLEAENKFQKELDALRKQRIDAELKEAKTIEDVDKLHLEKRALMEKEYQRQEQAIKLQYQKGEIASVKQRDSMIDQIEKTKTAKIKAYDRELKAEHKQAMKDMTNDSQNAAEGMANAFKEAAAESRDALTNWGEQGRQTVTSFQTHSTEAFLAVGAGSKSMGDAMRSMFLNVIADKAQSMGQELLLEGIWPPNPLALGAGAGLIALAGAIRAKAGGGGGVSVPASGGGGMVPVTANQTDSNQMQAQQPGQAVTIQVMGSYFETEQTKTKLMDIVRDATDATSFKYVQIGET